MTAIDASFSQRFCCGRGGGELLTELLRPPHCAAPHSHAGDPSRPLRLQYALPTTQSWKIKNVHQ
jgi:hypothetical protein